MDIYHRKLGQGPNLVLIHGWGFHSAIWQSLAHQLQSHYTLHLIDLPGYGKSPLPLYDYTLENLAHAVSEMIPNNSALLGWSLGGLVATQIALLNPSKINHVINIASSPKMLASDTWPGMTQMVIDRFSSELHDDYQATMKRFLMLQFQDPASQRTVIRGYMKLLLEHGSPDEAALLDSLQIIKQTDLRDQLTQLICPVDYILGRLDSLVPARVANELSKFVTSERVHLFSKSSHAPFLSEPNLFSKTITEILHGS